MENQKLIQKGSRILEIGVNKQTFVKSFSDIVGKDGRVYYFDINREELNRVSKIKKNNIRPHYLFGGEYKIKGELDLMFLNESYRHFKNRSEYFRYMKKYLSPFGKVVIIQEDSLLTLNFLLGRTVKRKTIIDEMVDAGFRLRQEHFFLKNKSFLTFERI